MKGSRPDESGGARGVVAQGGCVILLMRDIIAASFPPEVLYREREKIKGKGKWLKRERWEKNGDYLHAAGWEEDSSMICF